MIDVFGVGAKDEIYHQTVSIRVKSLPAIYLCSHTSVLRLKLGKEMGEHQRHLHRKPSRNILVNPTPRHRRSRQRQLPLASSLELQHPRRKQRLDRVGNAKRIVPVQSRDGFLVSEQARHLRHRCEQLYGVPGVGRRSLES
jgi:hypothetical protein